MPHVYLKSDKKFFKNTFFAMEKNYWCHKPYVETDDLFSCNKLFSTKISDFFLQLPSDWFHDYWKKEKKEVFWQKLKILRNKRKSCVCVWSVVAAVVVVVAAAVAVAVGIVVVVVDIVVEISWNFLEFREKEVFFSSQTVTEWSNPPNLHQCPIL